MQAGIEIKERGPPLPNSDHSPNPQAVPNQSIPPQPVVLGTAVVYPSATAPGVTTTVLIQNQMGTKPAVYVCKSCNSQITTRVERKSSLRTHLIALLLCVVGCCPFVCLPYCMDSCKNADHYCPNCNSYIGSYFR